MQIGRIYTVSFTGVAVTAQQDFFELVAPSDAVCMVMRLQLSQSTEVGDAAEEGLSVQMKSGMTTSGSGGSSATPIPKSLGDAAFGGTCEVNNTTKSQDGTIVTHEPWNWNIRVPFDLIFTPEEWKPLSPSARLAIVLATTPADSITMSGWLSFAELGG
jgi:hypothetical protein